MCIKISIFDYKLSLISAIGPQFTIKNTVSYTFVLDYFRLSPIRSFDMSSVIRKPALCINESKGADQLRGNRIADQRLCLRYIDSTIPLLSKC